MEISLKNLGRNLHLGALKDIRNKNGILLRREALVAVPARRFGCSCCRIAYKGCDYKLHARRYGVYGLLEYKGTLRAKAKSAQRVVP